MNAYKINREPNIHTFDEIINEKTTFINGIIVEKSCADVTVSFSDTSDAKEIKFHFHGKADIDGNVRLEVYIEDKKLHIAAIDIGNIFKNELKLDIFIPHKYCLENLDIESSGNIFLNEGIYASNIAVKSLRGSIYTNAGFESISVDAGHENQAVSININVNASQNTAITVSTGLGNIFLKLANIANINFVNLEDVNPNSMQNRLHDNYKRVYGGYVADLSYYLGCGNMEIS